MKIAFLTDSTATLDENLLNHPHVYYVSLQLNFSSGETFTEVPDRPKIEEVYHAIQKADRIPKTSQPQPQAFHEVYQSLINKGYDLVYFIPLSYALSGTNQTGQSVAKEYEDQIKTVTLSNGRVGLPLRFLVKETIKMVEEGLSTEEILPRFKWLNDHTTMWASIGDINHLVQGGRASRAKGIIASLLKIVPIIEFGKDGSIDLVAKVRTQRRALKWLADRFIEEAKKYSHRVSGALVHVDSREGAEEMARLIHEQLPDISLEIDWLTPVVGNHGGIGTLGLAVLPSLENYPQA